MVLIKAGKQEIGRWGEVFGEWRKLRGEMLNGIFYREFNSFSISF